MRKSKFSEEFIFEKINLVSENGNSVTDVAQDIGVSPQCLYKWIKKYSINDTNHEKKIVSTLRRENLQLKSSFNELKMEADILKKADAYFAKKPT